MGFLESPHNLDCTILQFGNKSSDFPDAVSSGTLEYLDTEPRAAAWHRAGSISARRKDEANSYMRMG